jgi:hypothetical protein
MNRRQTARPIADEGAALVTVMLVMMLLTSLVTAAVGYGLSAQPLSRRDQDAVAALAAAQAGIDDYLFRVRSSEFEQRSSTNLPPAPDNGPFLSTSWQAVPGATNGARFHYDAKLNTGALTVTSSGRVRNVTRTVQVLLRRASFLDYLYFTDFEVNSPESGFYGTNGSLAATQCPAYWWGDMRQSPVGPGRPDPDLNSTAVCTRISFGPSDVINGDLHSNDTISINGNTRFNGDVTTSLPNAICTPARRWWNRNNAFTGCGTPLGGTPVFSRTGDPAYQPILQLPQTSGALRTDAEGSGCLFIGPTQLTLNSTGTMTTTSPFTTATTTDADNFTRCVGTNKALPGVIFTRNALTSSPDETGGQCAGYTGNRLGFPIANDITRYECASGDIFVSGVLNGRLTVAAENDVVVVDDVTYQSYGQTTEDDMLGLIAEQFVRVYHPISCPSNQTVDANNVRVCRNLQGANLADTRFNTDTGGLFRDPKIHAAILALNDSFGVAQFNNGAQLGTLTVYGAIAQKWRGAVALTGASGYVKDYGYDPRLAYEGPPSFVDPVGKPWKVKAFAEVANPPACTSTRISLCVPP